MSASDKGALWGGRFEGSMDPTMVPLNLSLDVDGRLWPHDVRGSIAWARALGRAEVIEQEEADRLVKGLEAVAVRLGRDGIPDDAPDEDIHALVERLLAEEVGDLARKLHTGRSRNDQVATDLRLWVHAACGRLDAELIGLQRALIGLAEAGVDLVMPGYTHLQQAQPIRAAQWALSHFWPIERDRGRLAGVERSAGVLPLGSGAVTGCAFPIDRRAIAADLGFRDVTRNALDAISDRDFAVEFLSTCALIAVHLSRLAEDLVLFTSKEFGFVRLSDGFSTGSSLMPQKRNPDVAELTRGRTGRVFGSLTALLTILKGLPTGYNRDLQEDKVALFQAADSMGVVVPALAGAVSTATFEKARIHEALVGEVLATDLADYLVRRGVAFRDAHEIVGRLVREAEVRGCGLEDLSDADFRGVSPKFESDVRDVFEMEASVEARDATGGTSRRQIAIQLEEARALLG
jgi:argininosuccinate lyase